jgi:hypothetical protein
MNRKVGMKPVVVFIKGQPTDEDREGWYVCSVGNGPAINIKLARRPSGGSQKWEEGRRCPTLARGAHFPIKLGGFELQCDYEDIDGRWYSSRCKNWVTSFPKSRGERLPLNLELKRLEGVPGTT